MKSHSDDVAPENVGVLHLFPLALTEQYRGRESGASMAGILTVSFVYGCPLCLCSSVDKILQDYSYSYWKIQQKVSIYTVLS